MSGKEVKAEEVLPLDIPFAKLFEWLADRKKTTTEWKAALVKVRELVNQALLDMPDIKQVTDMLTGKYLTYFHAKKILELMKADTQEGASSFWRGYTSKRTRDWIAIISAYEKDGVYLGETANTLQNNVTYEVPALRRQLARLAGAVEECNRRESEFNRLAQQLADKFATQCKELELEGKDIKKELAVKVETLSGILSQLITKLRGNTRVADAVALYRDFTEYVGIAGRDESEKREVIEYARNTLPALFYVLQHGNETIGTVQRRWSGHPDPTSVVDQRPAAAAGAASAGSSKANEIDFGDSGGIDFGGIDFGDEPTTTAGAGNAGTGAAAGADEIDWGFEMVPSASAISTGDIDWGDMDMPDMSAESPAMPGSSAAGAGKGPFAIPSNAPAYETLAENPATRALLLNDLVELQFFLKQRLHETAGKGNKQAALGRFSEREGASMLTSVIATIEEALATFQSSRVSHLLLIKSSPKYLERFAQTINSKTMQSQQYAQQAVATAKKRVQLQEEITEVQPKLRDIITDTKELKKELETALAEVFQRPVKIIGEINTL